MVHGIRYISCQGPNVSVNVSDRLKCPPIQIFIYLMSLCNHRNSSLFSLSSLDLSYIIENFQSMHLGPSMNKNLIKEENEQLVKANKAINYSVLLLKK